MGEEAMDDFDNYELKKYEILGYKEILAWEKKKDGYVTKVIGAAGDPIRYLVDKIEKKRFQRFENVVAGVVASLYRVSELTVSRKRLKARLKKYGVVLEGDDLDNLKRCWLKQLDACHYRYLKIHGASAAIQGGVAGITGELAAPVDLSTLLIRIFNMIQTIAFCYGFDPDDRLEKEIILRIIIVSLGARQVRQEVLKEICYLRIKQQESHVGHYTDVLTKKAMDRTVERLGVAVFVKLFSRAVPIVSVVVSAHSNYELMTSANQAAFMIYRKHFIDRKRFLEGSWRSVEDQGVQCECA